MLTVTIITPEKSLPPVQAVHVTLPAVDGEVGVRVGHTALVAQLKIGFTLIRTSNGKESLLVIKGGIAQVLKDQVRLFVDAALDAESIDLPQVQKRLEQLGASVATDPATRKRNEIEATWNLMQQSVAQRRAAS